MQPAHPPGPPLQLLSHPTMAARFARFHEFMRLLTTPVAASKAGCTGQARMPAGCMVGCIADCWPNHVKMLWPHRSHARTLQAGALVPATPAGQCKAAVVFWGLAVCILLPALLLVPPPPRQPQRPMAPSMPMRHRLK